MTEAPSCWNPWRKSPRTACALRIVLWSVSSPLIVSTGETSRSSMSISSAACSAMYPSRAARLRPCRRLTRLGRSCGRLSRPAMTGTSVNANAEKSLSPTPVCFLLAVFLLFFNRASLMEVVLCGAVCFSHSMHSRGRSIEVDRIPYLL